MVGNAYQVVRDLDLELERKVRVTEMGKMPKEKKDKKIENKASKRKKNAYIGGQRKREQIFTE